MLVTMREEHQLIAIIEFIIVDKTRPSLSPIRALYYYKVMLFCFKNVGATYQCLVNKLFKEKIGKIMKIYIDDMLTNQ